MAHWPRARAVPRADGRRPSRCYFCPAPQVGHSASGNCRQRPAGVIRPCPGGERCRPRRCQPLLPGAEERQTVLTGDSSSSRCQLLVFGRKEYGPTDDLMQNIDVLLQQFWFIYRTLTKYHLSLCRKSFCLGKISPMI